MADQDEAHLAELKKKRTFRKFTYRGVDLDQLLDMSRYVFLRLDCCRHFRLKNYLDKLGRYMKLVTVMRDPRAVGY